MHLLVTRTIISGAAALLAGGALAVTAPHAAAGPVITVGSSDVPGATYPDVPSPQNTTTGEGPGAANFVDAFIQSFSQPRLAPVGTNDWNCRPTAEHPTPVVLIHGTWENAYDNWSGMSPELKQDGYCVFALNFGDAGLDTRGGLGSALPNAFGTKDVADSAGEIATFVDAVREATGADKVDLVGHSQGGLVSRQYLKFNGGAEKVRKVVTLGATNHGTTLSGIGTLDRFVGSLGLQLDPALTWLVGSSGMQQVYGSDIVNGVNEGGDTLPGIDYTVIATKYDEVTSPYTSSFLTAGPGATVKNITVQDGCAADHSDHISMTYSPRVVDLVRNALTPGSAGTPRCTPNSPIMGAGTTEITEGIAPTLGWLSENAREW